MSFLDHPKIRKIRDRLDYIGDEERLKAFLAVSRAPFLSLPVLLVALGTAAAAWECGHVYWMRAFWALVGLLLLHIGVNAINEASDAKRGIDGPKPESPFSGGSGTVPSGRLTIKEAYGFGMVATAAGVLIGLGFLFVVGWRMVPLILMAVVLVAGYTDLFARIGLGEVAAGLGLGLLPVLGSALVQAGSYVAAAWAAGMVSFLLTFDLLLLNEFPDQDSDRKGGRKNLVLMLGPGKAARVWFWTALAVPVFLLHFIALGLLPWPCFAAVFTLILLKDAFEWTEIAGDRFPTPPRSVLKDNILWNMATHGLVAAGLVVAVWL